MFGFKLSTASTFRQRRHCGRSSAPTITLVNPSPTKASSNLLVLARVGVLDDMPGGGVVAAAAAAAAAC